MPTINMLRLILNAIEAVKGQFIINQLAGYTITVSSGSEALKAFGVASSKGGVVC